MLLKYGHCTRWFHPTFNGQEQLALFWLMTWTYVASHKNQRVPCWTTELPLQILYITPVAGHPTSLWSFHESKYYWTEAPTQVELVWFPNPLLDLDWASLWDIDCCEEKIWTRGERNEKCWAGGWAETRHRPLRAAALEGIPVLTTVDSTDKFKY